MGVGLGCAGSSLSSVVSLGPHLRNSPLASWEASIQPWPSSQPRQKAAAYMCLVVTC